MVSEASLRALDACCSPWASITWDKMEINNQNSVLLIITLAFILNHLGLGLSGGLRLSCHGPLQLLGQPHILDLHPFHGDSPAVSGRVQGAQHRLGDVLPVSQNVLNNQKVKMINNTHKVVCV